MQSAVYKGEAINSHQGTEKMEHNSAGSSRRGKEISRIDEQEAVTSRPT